MPDPDAARIGHTYNPTKKPENQYSRRPKYTPAPSQAVQGPRPSGYTPQPSYVVPVSYQRQQKSNDKRYPKPNRASGTVNVNAGGSSRYYGITPELRDRIEATKDVVVETGKSVAKVAALPVVVASTIPRAQLHALNVAIDKANETASKVASLGANVTEAQLNVYREELAIAKKAAAKAASVGYDAAKKELTTLDDALIVANEAAGAVTSKSLAAAGSVVGGPLAVAGTVASAELNALDDALAYANKQAAKVASAGVNVKKAELKAYSDALAAAKKAAGAIVVGPVAKAELYALNEALDAASEKVDGLVSGNKLGANVDIHKIGVAGSAGVSKYNRSAYDTEAKRGSSVDARAQVKDYKEDLKVIRQARKDQRQDGGKDFAKGDLTVLSYNKADKMAKEARQYLKLKKKEVEPEYRNPGTVYTGPNGGSGGGSGGNGTGSGGDGGGGNGKGGGGNGKGLDKAKNIHGKMKNAATGGSGNSYAPDPNGNNLMARFAKVFGTEAQTKLDEAIKAYNQSGAGTITEQNPGQYGHTYILKDAKGNVITNTDDIKSRLIAYTSASAANTTQYANDPNSATMAATMTRLQLVGSQGGGNLSGITRRLASAYTGGDQAKATDLITQAILKNPNKIEIKNPGQPGSYIQVRQADGSYTSNSDAVAKFLASNVQVNGAKPVAYNQQTHQQQAVLSGANGMAVMNRLNFAMNTTGTERLQQAINEYNKKNGADIKINGTLGQPGFYLSVKTANGPISGTNAILNKLKPYTGTRVPGAQVAPPPAAPAAPPVGDPGSAQPPSSDGSGGTDGSGAGDGSSDGSTDGGSAGADGSGGGGTGGADGSQQGTDGTNGQNQGQKPDNKPKGSVDNGPKQNDKATADILSLSAAAQKSQALIGVELKQPSGQVAKKVDQKLYAAADHSQNNIISKNEAARYASVANTDGKAGVSRAEAKDYNKALNVVDLNNDGKSGKKEAKALLNALDTNNDGNLGKKERANAKQTLKAQIDSKDKKEADYAQTYLAKAGKKSGGTSQQELGQAAALVNAQVAKPKKNDDGPGKKNNKKN